MVFRCLPISKFLQIFLSSHFTFSCYVFAASVVFTHPLFSFQRFPISWINSLKMLLCLGSERPEEIFVESKKIFLQDWVLSPDLTKPDALIVSSFIGVETQHQLSLGLWRKTGREVPGGEGEAGLLELDGVGQLLLWALPSLSIYLNNHQCFWLKK